MCRWRYQDDSTLTELETEIVEVGRDGERWFAVTADTIFYPEGGGQPADHGFMNDVAVVDVQKSDPVIRHLLDSELAPGPVHQRIDWARRFDHMQQHTGQHLLTVVALRRFGWATTAFHMGPSVSDIELDTPSLSSDDLRRLEDAVAEEILAAHPVTIRYARLDEMEALGVRSRLLPDGFKGELRLVEIGDLDRNTCGGTHLRSTGEIGSLALIGAEPMRGGSRVFFVAGHRVRRRLARHEARNLRLRTLLDAADDDLPELVELRLGREKELAREKRRLLGELAQVAAEALAAGDDPVAAAHWDGRDLCFLQEVGKRLAGIAPERVALLTAGVGDDGSFLVVAPEGSWLDLGTAGPEVAAILGGRGGGRAPFFQGRATKLSARGDAVEALARQPARPDRR